jgi:hypothetical protein
MKMYLLLILTALLVGCSQVDEHGVTDEVISEPSPTAEIAAKCSEHYIMVLCLKYGYEDYKVLTTSIYTNSNKNKYWAKSIGRCIR